MGQQVVQPDPQPVRARRAAEWASVGTIKCARLSETVQQCDRGIAEELGSCVASKVFAILRRRLTDEDCSEYMIHADQMLDDATYLPFFARCLRRPLLRKDRLNQRLDRRQRSLELVKWVVNIFGNRWHLSRWRRLWLHSNCQPPEAHYGFGQRSTHLRSIELSNATNAARSAQERIAVSLAGGQ